MTKAPTERSDSAPIEVFVARQPIFEANKNLAGYELLFRTGAGNFFPAGVDPDTASKEIIGQTLSVFGLDSLVGDKLAYVNVTRRTLLEGTYAFLPPGRLVLELLETMLPDPETLAACQAAKRAGYMIALDDFSGQPQLDAFVPYCDVIKVDFQVADPDTRMMIARRHAGGPVKLLAEKVESIEEFEEARGLGYAFFQGYFFCRPEVLSRQDIPVSKLVYLQFLSQINRPTLDWNRLEQVIKQDVALSVKLLRYLKAAAFGFRGEITSIKHGLALLGERPFRRWASILAMSQLSNDKPPELLATCLVRARFCEELAPEAGFPSRQLDLFVLGLFSLMDAVVGRPLRELLNDIALPGDLVEALVPTGKQSRARDVLELVVAYERADWLAVEYGCNQLGLVDAIRTLPRYYQDALSWAMSITMTGRS